MDRRSKIFAPIKKIGGTRVSVKPPKPSDMVRLRATLGSFKEDMRPTFLKVFKYQSDGETIKYSAKVDSICAKGNKPICFVVKGNDPKLANNKKADDDLVKDIKMVESSDNLNCKESDDINSKEKDTNSIHDEKNVMDNLSG